MAGSTTTQNGLLSGDPSRPSGEDKRTAMREVFARVPVTRSRAGSFIAAEKTAGADDPAARAYPAGTVPALAQSIAVMAYLNSQAPIPATLAEISTTLKISKSHCHAILRTLSHFEWVVFDPRLKTYALQSGVLSDISSLLESPTLEVIRTALAALVARVEVPCVLSQPLADHSFVVIETFRSRHFMQVFYPVGHRFPDDACAQMRAFLAWQPQEAIDARLKNWTGVRYTAKTLVEPDAVRREIGRTRTRGYARSASEFSEGMFALALPVFNRTGQVAYVMSCSWLMADRSFDETFIEAEMRSAVAEIHRITLARCPPGL